MLTICCIIDLIVTTDHLCSWKRSQTDRNVGQRQHSVFVKKDWRSHHQTKYRERQKHSLLFFCCFYCMNIYAYNIAILSTWITPRWRHAHLATLAVSSFGYIGYASARLWNTTVFIVRTRQRLEFNWRLELKNSSYSAFAFFCSGMRTYKHVGMVRVCDARLLRSVSKSS